METMAKERLTIETKFDATKPYSVKKVENKELKSALGKKKKINTYKKCEFMTGVINQIVSKNNKKRELSLQPVYYQLNPQSINLYNTLGNKAQLLSVLNIDNVVRLLEIFSGTHCITFVVRMENKRENEALTLCADNNKDKQNFIHMVTEFKECDIKVMTSEVNEQVLMDFSKVNYLLTPPKQPKVAPALAKIIAAIPGAKPSPAAKARMAGKAANKAGIAGVRPRIAALVGKRTPEEDKDLLNGMYYDNSQKTIRRKPAVVLRTQQMKKHVDSIITEIQMGNLAQKQLQRQYQGKMAEAEKVAKVVEKQKDIVREILQKRAEKEKERKTMIKQKKVRNKELKLMKAVKMQIHKIKRDEIKETKQALKKQLNFIKGIPEKKPKAVRGVSGSRKITAITPGAHPVMTKSKGIIYKLNPAVTSELQRINTTEEVGVYASELPAEFENPLSRAVSAQMGPFGDNKLRNVASSIKKYAAHVAALKNPGALTARRGLTPLKALAVISAKSTKPNANLIAARKGIKSFGKLVKVTTKVTKVKIPGKGLKGAKGSKGKNGFNPKYGNAGKPKVDAKVSLAGRNTNFATFAAVPGGVPKEATGFTANGVPITTDEEGAVTILTNTNLESPNRLLDYGICTQRDRLFGFVDTDHIYKICKRLYGENRVEECRQKTKFCGMCCDYHVGSHLPEENQNCNLMCESIIIGDKVNTKSDNKGPKKSGQESFEGNVSTGKSGDATGDSRKPKTKESTTKQMKKFFKA